MPQGMLTLFVLICSVAPTFPSGLQANRIDAAFMQFDYSGTGFLDDSEINAMPHGRKNQPSFTLSPVTGSR